MIQDRLAEVVATATERHPDEQRILLADLLAAAFEARKLTPVAG